MVCRVKAVGCRVQGAGCRVQGVGCVMGGADSPGVGGGTCPSHLARQVCGSDCVELMRGSDVWL